MKGQVQQVFIYMMIIIVVGGIMLMGYRSIDNILGTSCSVEISNFKSSLTSDLDRNTRHGNVQNVEYRVPCSYDTVCFATHESGDHGIKSEIMNAELDAGTGQNIFFFEGDVLRDTASYDNLASELHECFEETGGRFRFTLQGVAGRVNVR